MKHCKTIMDLFSYDKFSEAEAADVKEWYDKVAFHFQDVGTLIDMNGPISEYFGGDIYIISDIEDLHKTLQEYQTTVESVPIDGWRFISDTGVWFFTANNNAGGPNFFVHGSAFQFLKDGPYKFDEIFKREFIQNAGDN